MIQVILKFKAPYDDPATAEDTLKLMAAYAMTTFGEGGNDKATQIEDYIGIVNTPPQNGHIRILVPSYYAQALEYIESNGGSIYASLVWVGWPGVEEIVVSWPIIENGVEIGRQELGRFA